MNSRLIEATDKSINKILDDGINASNLDHLYKLTKIEHIAKEEENMNYGNYGNYGARRPGYDTYGRYDEYGARGYDRKYRGHEHLDKVSNEYGRYMENRERYGASEETDKSFHYMVQALEDFIKVLEEEANTPQEKQQLRQALQNSMR